MRYSEYRNHPISNDSFQKAYFFLPHPFLPLSQDDCPFVKKKIKKIKDILLLLLNGLKLTTTFQLADFCDHASTKTP